MPIMKAVQDHFAPMIQELEIKEADQVNTIESQTTDIEKLKKELASKAEHYAEKEASSVSISGELQQSREDNAALRNKNGEIRGELDTLNTINGNLRASKSQNDAEINTLRRGNREIKSSNERYSSQNEALREQITTLDSQLTGKNNELQAANSRIQALESQVIHNASVQQTATETALRKQVAAMQAQMDDVEQLNRWRWKNNDQADLQKEKQERQTIIERDMAVHALKFEPVKKELQDKLDQKEQENKELQTKYETKEQERKDLQAKLDKQASDSLEMSFNNFSMGGGSQENKVRDQMLEMEKDLSEQLRVKTKECEGWADKADINGWKKRKMKQALNQLIAKSSGIPTTSSHY